MTAVIHDAILDDIANRCLAAVLAGGTTWLQFKAEAVERIGLPWPEIVNLLNQRSASRKARS